jgi:hypothetical protein
VTHDVPQLTRLLRSFFSKAELRLFVGGLDMGDDMLAHLPSTATTLAEDCAAVAALLDRWGTPDADLFAALHHHRPSRLHEVMAYQRLRSAGPTTCSSRTATLELNASIAGDEVGVYRLRPGQLKSIGRSSDAEIRFPVDLVKLSRMHAWVSWPLAGPTIQDLDSKNGTWINGRRARQAPLREGDTLQLGEVNLVILQPDRTLTAGPTADDTQS